MYSMKLAHLLHEHSGAEIYNGDVLVGKTPDTLELRRGLFNLTLRQSGFKDAIARGTLGESNALEKITVEMTPDGSVVFGKDWTN